VVKDSETDKQLAPSAWGATTVDPGVPSGSEGSISFDPDSTPDPELSLDPSGTGGLMKPAETRGTVAWET